MIDLNKMRVHLISGQPPFPDHGEVLELVARAEAAEAAIGAGEGYAHAGEVLDVDALARWKRVAENYGMPECIDPYEECHHFDQAHAEADLRGGDR